MSETYEDQSQFNVGLDIAKHIQERLIAANNASHYMSMPGLQEWWLNLQDVDRSVAPRIKQKEHKQRLDAVRVNNLPLSSRSQNPMAVILFYRKKLTAYQIELEFLRDKLGLGFKPGDDPRGAILR